MFCRKISHVFRNAHWKGLRIPKLDVTFVCYDTCTHNILTSLLPFFTYMKVGYRTCPAL